MEYMYVGYCISMLPAMFHDTETIPPETETFTAVSGITTSTASNQTLTKFISSHEMCNLIS